MPQGAGQKSVGVLLVVTMIEVLLTFNGWQVWNPDVPQCM